MCWGDVQKDSIGHYYKRIRNVAHNNLLGFAGCVFVLNYIKNLCDFTAYTFDKHTKKRTSGRVLKWEKPHERFSSFSTLETLSEVLVPFLSDFPVLCVIIK